MNIETTCYNEKYNDGGIKYLSPTIESQFTTIGMIQSHMNLGDSNLENENFTKNPTKVKADFFDAIFGSVLSITIGIQINFKTW